MGSSQAAGKTDFEYIDRVIQLHLPTRRVTVIHGSGDVKWKIRGLEEALGDLQRSPFQSRIFVVLDSIHQPGLVADLTAMGVLRENIVTWTQNGIEHLYPESLLLDSFGGTSDISIEHDRISAGGITLTKSDLCEEVLVKIDTNTVLPDELQRELLDKIEAAIA